MALPSFQTDLLDLRLLQTQWASQLNPVIALPPNKGIILKNVKLVTGTNVINHLLQRNLQGYIVIGMKDAFAEIFTTTSPTPNLTLNLTSSAATTIDLWVF